MRARLGCLTTGKMDTAHRLETGRIQLRPDIAAGQEHLPGACAYSRAFLVPVYTALRRSLARIALVSYPPPVYRTRMSQGLYTLWAVAEVVSARMGADLLGRLDEVLGGQTRGAWLLSVAEAALTVVQPPAALGVDPLPLAGGIPSLGAVCMHAGCWLRDTSRYGDPDDHGGLTLCLRHAHDAVGSEYTRPRKPLPRLADVS
jgi:hypothetical protein